MAGPSACLQLRQLLKEALRVLQEEGFIYHKVKSQDEVYLVRHSSDLLLGLKVIVVRILVDVSP